MEMGDKRAEKGGMTISRPSPPQEDESAREKRQQCTEEMRAGMRIPKEVQGRERGKGPKKKGGTK